MNRSDVSWAGYWVACPTPYGEDGELRLDLLEALLDHYVEHKVHGVLINGTTGEWFSQTSEERKLVANTAVDVVGGRVPVVVGCTDYTAKAVVALADHAMTVGASGVTASPPAYSRPLDPEIVAYYVDIAEALPQAPLMVYNWPSGTNVDMGPDLLASLADIDTVVAVKNSTGDFGSFAESTRRVISKIRVFGPFMSPEGYRLLKAAGGDGFVGGGAPLDEDDPEFWESYWRGETAYCESHAARTDRIFERLWLPGGWRGKFGHYQSQLKAMMAMIGQPGGTVRPPRLPITDPVTLDEIRRILVEEGMIAEGAETSSGSQS